MSGRGRGINNAPAWMTRGEFPGGGGPPGGSEPDAFGRFPQRGDGWDRNHPPPGDRGPPPPRYGRGPPPRGPPRGGDRYDDRGRYDDRHDDRGGRYDRRGPGPQDHYRGGGRGRGPPPRRHQRDNSGIAFRSYEEEQNWVEDRRRKRISRNSKFDEPPTPQQLAADAAAMAFSNPAATDFAGIPADRNFSAVPQQTRHARRLYIGHLPPNVTEQELHVFFRAAVQQAFVEKPTDDEDPILSVYINHERRFCFLEFKTVEMATACLALDGIDIHGKGKVKVKRPNDYNSAMAPKVHPSAIPQLDVSRLGIISGTVQDGPNKIFIGGLHYHLSEEQVLELLQAFGKVKAFHLVKNEPDSLTSKGYCFVEYSDPNVTQVAVIGLNGMDLGGGKILTARVAGERTGALLTSQNDAANTPNHETSAPRPDAIIINGYDIEALVDAAMGLRPMPTAPMHLDQFGMPITRTTNIMPPAVTPAAGLSPGLPPGLPPPPGSTAPPRGTPPQASGALPPGSSALDIANAVLNAAFGTGGGGPPPPAPSGASQPTRILVLLNMVSDEDLATDEEYHGLLDEVQEECAKFGKLLGMNVPRRPSATVEPSAVKKIFLEYATPQDAANAEQELAGRQFGPNVVQASYFDEKEYQSGVLR